MLSTSFRTLLFGLFFSITTCTRAEIFDNATALPTSLTALQYDFIIVGGGTAGNVIANRLTENPKFNVLVIEAGPSNADVLHSQVPLLCATLQETQYDWNFTTTAQAGLNNRTLPYARGHILGGSSSLNYMIYTRGSSDDYDRYASISGDSGWSWKNLQPYFKKNELWTAPMDGHNTTGQFDPSVHSSTGINAVSLSGFPTPIDLRVVNATRELGGDFHFNLDMNSGKPLGVGYVQTTIKGSQRSSSATSYLAPNFLLRPNLHVVVNTRVSRLIQTGTQNGVVAIRGVEFESYPGGPLRTLTASKEVILSAGAINTPHILLNSGVGNAKDVSAMGIKSLVNLPDVGKNLVDHLTVGAPWVVSSTNTYDAVFQSATVQDQELLKWRTTGKSILVDTLVSQLGWLRLPKNSSALTSITDPSAGPNTPHYEIVFSNGLPASTPPSGNFLTASVILLTPTSRGSVKLASKNPFAAPLIDPGFLQTAFDKAVMREALKSIKTFLAAPSWSTYLVAPIGDFVNTTTDALLDTFVAASSSTTWHPVGTAQMSAQNAKTGVVNPDLLVKQTCGLRIVDASVLPYIPGAHTQAPVYVFAERAADLIKAAYA